MANRKAANCDTAFNFEDSLCEEIRARLERKSGATLEVKQRTKNEVPVPPGKAQSMRLSQSPRSMRSRRMWNTTGPVRKVNGRTQRMSDVDVPDHASIIAKLETENFKLRRKLQGIENAKESLSEELKYTNSKLKEGEKLISELRERLQTTAFNAKLEQTNTRLSSDLEKSRASARALHERLQAERETAFRLLEESQKNFDNLLRRSKSVAKPKRTILSSSYSPSSHNEEIAGEDKKFVVGKGSERGIVATMNDEIKQLHSEVEDLRKNLDDRDAVIVQMNKDLTRMMNLIVKRGNDGTAKDNALQEGIRRAIVRNLNDNSAAGQKLDEKILLQYTLQRNGPLLRNTFEKLCSSHPEHQASKINKYDLDQLLVDMKAVQEGDALWKELNVGAFDPRRVGFSSFLDFCVKVATFKFKADQAFVSDRVQLLVDLYIRRWHNQTQ